jgi:hypothetical protein
MERMAKLTKSQVRQMAEELLSNKSVADRYAYLEKRVKAAMVELEMPEIEVKGKGRVFISTSERVNFTPDLARDVLGSLAEKVIEIKESVSNKLVEALVKIGDIGQTEHEQLLAGAKKTDVISLYVRPLK